MEIREIKAADRSGFRVRINNSVECAVNTIANIRNYYVINASTGTAGQPTQEQFHDIKDVGYEVVINLSKENTELGWPVDERYIVTSLEMTYAHIPVDFDQPTSFDFRTFAFVMDCFCCKRVFIHCLANKRVSVFMFLYRVMRRRVPVAQARSDLMAVWTPNDVWQGFIDNELPGSA